MSQGLVTASYIVAAVLFIASLAGLSKQETAKYGNWFGITGMAIALIATIASPSVHGVIFILVAMVIGGAIGARLALKVEMTQMPELVAVLHSFVGLAAVLVGYNSFIELLPANAVQQLVLPLNGSPEEIMAAAQAAISQLAQQTASGHGHLTGAMLNIHLTEIFLGVFIGAVTFTGSIVAFGKLRGTISSKPLNIPHKHKLNLLAAVVSEGGVLQIEGHGHLVGLTLPEQGIHNIQKAEDGIGIAAVLGGQQLDAVKGTVGNAVAVNDQ